MAPLTRRFQAQQAIGTVPLYNEDHSAIGNQCMIIIELRAISLQIDVVSLTRSKLN